MRSGVVIAIVLALVSLFEGLGAVLSERLTSPWSYLQELGPTWAALLGLGLILMLAVGLLTLLVIFESSRQLRMAQAALRLEGESVELMIPASFQGNPAPSGVRELGALERDHQVGYLVVTDRRLLRLHAMWRGFWILRIAGWKVAELGLRSEISTVDLCERRLADNRWLARLLGYCRARRWLVIETTDDRRHAVLVDEDLWLGRLFQWFEEAGFPTSLRFESDLAEEPKASPLDYADLPPAEGGSPLSAPR